MTLNDILTAALAQLDRGHDAQTLENYRVRLTQYANDAQRELADALGLFRTDKVRTSAHRPFFACPQQPIEQFIAIERFNRIVCFYYHQWRRFNNLIGRKPFSTAHTLSAPADFFILIRRS